MVVYRLRDKYLIKTHLLKTLIDIFKTFNKSSNKHLIEVYSKEKTKI